jgi:hypothetical protein
VRKGESRSIVYCAFILAPTVTTVMKNAETMKQSSQSGK